MSRITTGLLPPQLYGDVLRSHAVAGLTLTETAYAPCFELRKHVHECAYLCLVLRGAYSEVYGTRTRVCKPSTLIFHSPGEAHSNRFGKDGGRCFNIQVGPGWLDRLRECSGVMRSQVGFYGGGPVGLAKRLYNEFRLMDDAAPLAIEGLMLEIVAEASRRTRLTSGRKIPGRIERAREFIRAHFRESIRLAHLAGAVDAHPVYLAREFRRHYGCTVGEYVRKLRVEFACSRLSGSDEPLGKIALSAGFSDQSHFSRTLRSLTGLSPTEYRKTHRPR